MQLWVTRVFPKPCTVYLLGLISGAVLTLCTSKLCLIRSVVVTVLTLCTNKNIVCRDAGSAGHRAQRITEMIKHSKKHTTGTMEKIQLDYTRCEVLLLNPSYVGFNQHE